MGLVSLSEQLDEIMIHQITFSYLVHMPQSDRRSFAARGAFISP